MDAVSGRGESGSAGARASEADMRPDAIMPMLLQEELSLAASRAKSTRRALRIIIRRLCGEFDWDFGEAWVPSRDGTVLKPGTVWPRSNPDYVPFRQASRRLGFLPGSGLPGRAWLERRPIGIADVEVAPAEHFTRRDAALATGIHTTVALPLLAGREDVVAIVVLYRIGPPRLDSREIEVLRHLVAPLGPVVAQKRVQVELAARERQQKAVAHLGMVALADETQLDALLDTAVRLTVATLGIGHCMLLEFRAKDETLQLRAGIGWKTGTRARISASPDTQAGYTLQNREPVIVPDFDRETRFEPSPLLREHGVVSGLSVVVYGHGVPYGVFSAHGKQRRSFTRDDVHFLQSVANIIGSTIERRRTAAELAEHRQHLETLVGRRTTQLEKSHERLRLAERLASVGTLAAGLGHDLGNTILPMLCRLDALAARNLPDSAQEDLDAVRHAVDYLRQLSQGLRHLAIDKDHRGGSHMTILPHWWKQASPLMRSALPARVTLSCTLPEELPPVAIAPHRLTQAVLNLVSNSAEAIEGEGEVSIVGSHDAEENCVRVSIMDDGKGMSTEARRHALEPFFTTKTRGLSTGLGLALVHGIAKACGGSVDIDTVPGEGTAIHLSIPTLNAPARRLIETDTDPAGPVSVVGISLGDQRMAAYASLLVRSAGLDVRECDPNDPGKCRIWITEPAAETHEAAKRFLAGGGRRRVVLFGDSPGREGPGYFFVDRRGGPDAMRQGLREVVFQLLEEEDE